MPRPKIVYAGATLGLRVLVKPWMVAGCASCVTITTYGEVGIERKPRLHCCRVAPVYRRVGSARAQWFGSPQDRGDTKQLFRCDPPQISEQPPRCHDGSS